MVVQELLKSHAAREPDCGTLRLLALPMCAMQPSVWFQANLRSRRLCPLLADLGPSLTDPEQSKNAL